MKNDSEYLELLEPAYATYDESGTVLKGGLSRLDLICMQLKVPNTDNSYLNALILKSRALDLLQENSHRLKTTNLKDLVTKLLSLSDSLDVVHGLEEQV